MKLGVPCARHAFTRGTIHALDRKQIEYQRAAFRSTRRSAYARLSELPVGDEFRSLSRFADSQRPTKLADEQARLIDLRDHQEARGPELNRGLVGAQQRSSLVAIHFDAKRKTTDILRPAGVNTARFGLAGAPAINSRFGLAGGKLPEDGPSGDQGEHDKEKDRVAKSGPAPRLNAR